MGFSAVANLDGTITGTFENGNYSNIKVEVTGRNLLEIYIKLVDHEHSPRFKNFPRDTFDPAKGLAELIARTIGYTRNPEITTKTESKNAKDLDEESSLPPTVLLPAYSKPSWDLAKCIHTPQRQVNAFLVKGGLFSDGLVALKNGNWEVTKNGFDYIDHVNNTPLPNMYVSTSMLEHLSNYLLRCILQGSIQTNLPFVQEAMILGVLREQGTGATITDNGFQWFFTQVSKDSLMEIEKALFHPETPDRCVQFLKCAPASVIADLIKGSHGFEGVDIESLVGEHLPFNQWAALSVQIKGRSSYEKIAKSLKQRVSSPPQK